MGRAAAGPLDAGARRRAGGVIVSGYKSAFGTASANAASAAPSAKPKLWLSRLFNFHEQSRYRDRRLQEDDEDGCSKHQKGQNE